MHWAILLVVFVFVILAIALIRPTERPEQQNRWFWDQMPTQRQPTEVINGWLWNETQDWLSEDPTHKISVIIWLDESFLNVHSVNQSEVAEWLESEHNATDVRIGSALGFIIADIPANEVFPISPAPVIEIMFSGTYPVMHLDPDF